MTRASSRLAKCTAYGCTRAASARFKRCDSCRKHIRELEAKRRAHRRRQGLCACGNRRAYKRKTCQPCLDYFSGRAAELGENRRIDGKCPKCGHRPPAKGLHACRQCLDVNKRAYARGDHKYKRLTPQQRHRRYLRDKPQARGRIKAWKARQRAAGRCITCGAKCKINKRTGKPHAMCPHHTTLATAASARRKGSHVGSANEQT